MISRGESFPAAKSTGPAGLTFQRTAQVLSVCKPDHRAINMRQGSIGQSAFVRHFLRYNTLSCKRLFLHQLGSSTSWTPAPAGERIHRGQFDWPACSADTGAADPDGDVGVDAGGFCCKGFCCIACPGIGGGFVDIMPLSEPWPSFRPAPCNGVCGMA